MLKKSASTLLFFGLLAIQPNVCAAEGSSQYQTKPAYNKQHILIVQWDQNIAPLPEDSLVLNTDVEVRVSHLAPFSQRIIKPLRINFDHTISSAEVIFLLRKLPAITTIEQQQNVQSLTLPDDPNYDQQEHHSLINSEGGWDKQTTCEAIKIAVLDSGIDLTHSDLTSNIWQNDNETINGIDDDGNGFIDDINGWNFITNNNDVTDDNGHGTHVSGILAAIGDNNVGVSGICWSAEIVPIKVLDESGNGDLTNIQSGIDYAVSIDARIIVMSLEFDLASPSFLATMQAAEQENDTLFFIAAGNENINIDKTPVYPASYSLSLNNTVSVANVDSNFDLSAKSNYGAQTLDISAPGENILSTWRNNNYSLQTGTSMSAPMVAGAAALALNREPDLTSTQLRSAILQTANQISGSKWLSKSGGVLDIDNLLDNLNDAHTSLFTFNPDNAQQIKGYGLNNITTLSYLLFTADDPVSIDVDYTLNSDSLLTLNYSPLRPGYFIAQTNTGGSNRLVSWHAEQPDAPTAIAVEENGSSGYAISWSGSDLAEYYQIERNIDGTWQQLDEIAATTTIYFDDDVPNFAILQYRLIASYRYLNPTTEEIVEVASDYSNAAAPNGEIFAGAWLTKELGQTRLDYDFINIRLQTDLDEKVIYSVTSGQLPNSLHLSDDFGHISGVPQEDGTFNFSITYRNLSGSITGTRAFTLVVSKAELDLLNEPNQNIPMNFSLDDGQLTSLQSKSVTGESFASVKLTAYNFAKDLSTVTVSADPHDLSGGNIESIYAQIQTGAWITLDNNDANISLGNGLSWKVEDNSIYDLNSEEDLIEVDFSVNWEQIPSNTPSSGDSGGGGSSGGSSTPLITLLLLLIASRRFNIKSSVINQ